MFPQGLCTLATVLLAPIAAYRLIRPCALNPGPFILSYRAVVAPEEELLISNDSRSLLHQIQRGPCLQMEYYGLKADFGNPLTIYGTCDYERMFRFTSVHVFDNNCWRSKMETWRAGHCEAYYSADDYLIDEIHKFWRLSSSISALSSGVHIELDRGVMGIDHLGKECMCNVSRDMASFWREKCPDGKRGVRSWKMEARTVVKLVTMILAMYLLVWILVCLVAR